MIKMEFINKFDAEENLYLELVHQIRTMIVCFQALKHKGLSINYVIMTLSTPKRSVSNRKVWMWRKETTEHYLRHYYQFQNQRIDLQAACRSVNLDFTVEALLKPDGPKRTPSKMKTIDEAITVFRKKTRHPDEVSVYPRRLQQATSHKTTREKSEPRSEGEQEATTSWSTYQTRRSCRVPPRGIVRCTWV